MNQEFFQSFLIEEQKCFATILVFSKLQSKKKQLQELYFSRITRLTCHSQFKHQMGLIMTRKNSRIFLLQKNFGDKWEDKLPSL